MTDTSKYEYDIFLSHNHKDEEWTEKLAARLEKETWQGRKLKVFFSPWDIRPGQFIPKEIDKALSKSLKVGLVMSPEAMGSAWVELERLVTSHIDISERQERLIPLHLRDCEIPTLLKPILSIDFRDLSKFEEGYRKLLAVIRGEPLPRGPHGSSDPEISLSISIPRPPVVGFVARHDKEGRDILTRLIEELAPQKNQLIALWGAGGVGKTTLAAEAAHRLLKSYARRIVWISADGRSDFVFSTLLDEIATQLGRADLRKLTQESKKQDVYILVVGAPTLIVLDNFETIVSNERTACAEFLFDLVSCSALITTRQNLSGVQNIPINALSSEEAREFVERFISQRAHEPSVFAGIDRDQVINAAEANPLVLQWVLAQIDLAGEPREVLDELARGEGDAAMRVFDRSFNLPQLKDGGQATLLALSLFAPSASRPGLARVAGFEKDVKRLNRKAVISLASLWLMRTTEGNKRLMIEGLTRELAKARLLSDKRVKEFQRRFVMYFLQYAKAHSQPLPEDFDALEVEKDNILRAIDLAFERKSWKYVMHMVNAIGDMLDTRGFLDEAILRINQALKAAHNIGDELAVAHFSHNLAIVYQNRGEPAQAERLYYESMEISKKLDDQSVIAANLHHLGWIAQDRGDLIEAQRLYNESLEISRRLDNQFVIAANLHHLGWVAQDQGDIAQAERLYYESMEISKKLSDQIVIAANLHHLAWIEQTKGDFARARSLYQESLEISRKFGDQYAIATSLHQLGTINLTESNFQQAEAYFNESLTIMSKLGDKKNLAECLESIGNLKVLQGMLPDALPFFADSLKIAESLADQLRIGSVKQSIATLKVKQGDKAEALRLLCEAMAIFEKLSSPKVENVRELLKTIEGTGK